VPRRSVGRTELCVLCFPAQGMGAFCLLGSRLHRSGAVDERLLPSFSFYSSVIPASFFLDLQGVADRIFLSPTSRVPDIGGGKRVPVPICDRRFGRETGVAGQHTNGHLERQGGVASFSVLFRRVGEPCLLGLRHFILPALFWFGAGMDSYD